jgi:hypothetical protein
VKRLFYLSASILMLALAFHFGYTIAKAQAPGNPVVAPFGFWAVVTANGDVYNSRNGADGPWVLTSNVFGSGPTPTSQESWGQLKARYAPSHAPTSQAPPNK